MRSFKNAGERDGTHSVENTFYRTAECVEGTAFKNTKLINMCVYSKIQEKGMAVSAFKKNKVDKYVCF